jgi:hypothetical protein
MDTRNAESHGTTGGAYEESSVGADASASTSETHTGTSESPLSAVEAATALSLCATLHLQVVHAQARFVAEEVQKLQYDAATPEAIIASPSIDVTLQGPGGRAASDAEATVMSLMDSSGLLSSPSSLQEAMILMTKLKNVSHLSYLGLKSRVILILCSILCSQAINPTSYTFSASRPPQNARDSLFSMGVFGC